MMLGIQMKSHLLSFQSRETWEMLWLFPAWKRCFHLKCAHVWCWLVKIRLFLTLTSGFRALFAVCVCKGYSQKEALTHETSLSPRHCLPAGANLQFSQHSWFTGLWTRQTASTQCSPSNHTAALHTSSLINTVA